MRFFFYGTLCHPPLLRAVLGRDVALRPAQLADHAVHWVEGDAFPMILAAAGRVAAGAIAEELSPDDMARLDFYEGGFGYGTREVGVTTADGAVVPARVYFPDPGRWRPGPDWSLADWVARWGATVTATAADFMALRGERAAPEVLDRYGLMLVRGASRARAAEESAPARLRRAAAAEDVAVTARRQPYARFFAVEEYDLAFRRFAGDMSAQVNRAVFVTGDAATVLPYDPVRDRVLLIEQFRAGPFARGDRNPWLLEPVAGRIDAGETPEEAARREAVEEAGLTLGALHLVGRYYPSPAAKSEFLHSFVGIADLPDDAARHGGLASEAEDIRGHLLGYEAFRDIAGTPEAANGPLLLSAFWLDRHRPALRAAAGAGRL